MLGRVRTQGHTPQHWATPSPAPLGLLSSEEPSVGVPLHQGSWGPSWLSGVGLLRAVEAGGATPHFGDHCCGEKGDCGHQVMPSQLLLRTLGAVLPGLRLLDGISSPAGLCPGLCLTAEPRARAASAAGQTQPWHSFSSGKLHQCFFQRRLSFSPEQPRATIPPKECGRGQQSPVGPSRGSLVWTAAYTCGSCGLRVGGRLGASRAEELLGPCLLQTASRDPSSTEAILEE